MQLRIVQCDESHGHEQPKTRRKHQCTSSHSFCCPSARRGRGGGKALLPRSRSRLWGGGGEEATGGAAKLPTGHACYSSVLALSHSVGLIPVLLLCSDQHGRRPPKIGGAPSLRASLETLPPPDPVPPLRPTWCLVRESSLRHRLPSVQLTTFSSSFSLFSLHHHHYHQHHQ